RLDARSPVGDLERHHSPIAEIGDSYQGAEGQSPARRGELAVVEVLAVGGGFAVMGPAIRGCEAQLGEVCAELGKRLWRGLLLWSSFRQRWRREWSWRWRRLRRDGRGNGGGPGWRHSTTGQAGHDHKKGQALETTHRGQPIARERVFGNSFPAKTDSRLLSA